MEGGGVWALVAGLGDEGFVSVFDMVGVAGRFWGLSVPELCKQTKHFEKDSEYFENA